LLLEDLFIDVIHSRKTATKPRQSSLIQQWLGTHIPQSASIRIGYYIEDLFVKLLGEKSILNELTKKGKTYNIIVDGTTHQVDLLARVNGEIFHREIKCNIDLDNGKSRDVLFREECIVNGLFAKYRSVINSAVFCPFLESSQYISRLGNVEGLNDFIKTFQLDISLEDFISLGRSEQIHTALLS
jgi:hypothetical protein